MIIKDSIRLYFCSFILDGHAENAQKGRQVELV